MRRTPRDELGLEGGQGATDPPHELRVEEGEHAQAPPWGDLTRGLPHGGARPAGPPTGGPPRMGGASRQASPTREAHPRDLPWGVPLTSPPREGGRTTGPRRGLTADEVLEEEGEVAVVDTPAAPHAPHPNTARERSARGRGKGAAGLLGGRRWPSWVGNVGQL